MINEISSPGDLAKYTPEELISLASQIRKFLIEKVSKTGGHLGPNLGVVELTIALHRTFKSPKDVIVFDTGHQTYVHKILTGRADGFDLLRQRGGLAGYPNRSESVHDVIENSHASTALSWGDGISRGFSLTDQENRCVVVVVGDGALTGGMSWEALNNISADINRNLIIVVNDNERSYSPTIGGLATYLSTLRVTKEYEWILKWGKKALLRIPLVGSLVYDIVHGIKKGAKDFLAPQGMFEDLGLKYMGPIDGHDIAAMEIALKKAKSFGGPVLVHAITEKGRGYQPAIADEAEKFHAVGVVDPETGIPLKSSGPSWTSVFSKELLDLGKKRKDVVAITAAMLGPTGLDQFAEHFPDRTIDVGIAEQHAVTSAAGMAFAGLHPVVALYSTFLNRAFDQMLLDVGLHNAGVTFVLDRAGITGDDGPSHHGIWDLALSGIVPKMQINAPRDGARLREALQESLKIDNAPSLIRFPKGAVPADIPAVERVDGIDTLFVGKTPDILLISVGAVADVAIEVAQTIGGLGITVVDLRWVKPLPSYLLTLVKKYQAVVVIEDGIRHAGIASSISEMFRDTGISTPIHSVGVPLAFIEHSKRSQILEDIGMTTGQICSTVEMWFQNLTAMKQRPEDGNAHRSHLR
ncbi:MAG: 1-deoxy-D-xylulose-5-phosphate synthase [Actinobacteria bacterium]|uniref:1-deoxy-D-xylulose-5-phosphate synthase n=1 Tax=freshwater metagenome TaxID=449393 RepID=A0A6J7BUH6_9ZZZZ|nr:1-deoxy-D-xylulose-5-phosphate synthase [Actinomycetota bacterium]